MPSMKVDEYELFIKKVDKINELLGSRTSSPGDFNEEAEKYGLDSVGAKEYVKINCTTPYMEINELLDNLFKEELEKKNFLTLFRGPKIYDSLQ